MLMVGSATAPPISASWSRRSRGQSAVEDCVRVGVGGQCAVGQAAVGFRVPGAVGVGDGCWDGKAHQQACDESDGQNPPLGPGARG
jgi:hypothetical protein